MDIESRRQDQEIMSYENNTFQPRICVKSKELYSDTNYAIHERLINKKVSHITRIYNTPIQPIKMSLGSGQCLGLT